MKPSQSPSTTNTVLQIFKPSGTQSHFPTQQPSEVSTFPPASIPINKTSHITISVLSEQPSGSPSVAVSVHHIPLPSIAPTTLLLYI